MKHVQNKKTAAKQEKKVLRVAAYCRVSTKLEEQEKSYDIQVDYFTEKISKNPEMIFAGIYGDNGKSGLKTRGREGLEMLIRDCEAEKIDLILTKSISRFARSMSDCAEMIHRLRELGVSIFLKRNKSIRGNKNLIFTECFCGDGTGGKPQHQPAYLTGSCTVCYGYKHSRF